MEYKFAITFSTDRSLERYIIQRHASHRQTVPGVVADHVPRAQIPQLGALVGGGGEEVQRVGGVDAVPDPALVLVERGLQVPGAGLPELDGLVGRGGGDRAQVGRDDALEQVVFVGLVVLRLHQALK